MWLRPAYLALLFTLSAGCVSSGNHPLDTRQGRMEARDAYIQLGLAYLQRGQTEQARIPLKNALALDADSAEAHAALAMVFQAEQEEALADQAYRKALSHAPDDTRVLNNYGGFLYQQQRYQEARRQWLKACDDALYPGRSGIFENLGHLSLRLNDRHQAKIYFEKSLRLSRQQPNVAFELAELAFHERKYQQAQAYFAIFSRSGRQDARSLLLGIRLGRIFEDRDTVVSYALQLKSFYPESSEYQEFQAEK